MKQATILLAIQLLSASALAETDFSIFISRQYVEASVVLAVQRLNAALPIAPVWTAAASRLSVDSVHVRANGTFNAVPVAAVDFDVTIGCGDAALAEGNACNPDSAIAIEITNVAATIRGTQLPEAQRQQVQQTLNARVVDVSNDVTCSLDQFFAWVNTRSICPTINVTPQAAVTAALDLLHGCINGRAKTEMCVRPYHGRLSSRCENGKWIRISGVCLREPEAPPGGERP